MTEQRAPLPPRGLPPRLREGHKGTSGHVLVLAGSADMPGAALLVTGAALRAGAGLVRAVDLVGALRPLLPVACPEAVLVTPERPDQLDPDGRFALGAEHALVLGPGLGANETTHRRAVAALETWRAPMVVDADGLNVFAGEPEHLRKARGPLVITPHPGEAARLLGAEAPVSAPDRVSAARELVRRTGAVVVLKGHGTVVCDERGAWIDGEGGPELAVAGSGDVLAGVLGALLAGASAHLALGAQPAALTREECFDWACAAVWLHGRAGHLARGDGPIRGVLARDVIENLPAAIGALEREFGSRRG